MADFTYESYFSANVQAVATTLINVSASASLFSVRNLEDSLDILGGILQTSPIGGGQTTSNDVIKIVSNILNTNTSTLLQSSDVSKR